MKMILAGALVALVLVAAGSASAAKPPTATVTGPLDPVTFASVSPSLGDVVVFQVVTDYSGAWLQVQCFQAGVLVYSGLGLPDATFQLGPTPSWLSGSASCVAEVFTVRRGELDKVIGSVSFTVAG